MLKICRNWTRLGAGRGSSPAVGSADCNNSGRGTCSRFFHARAGSCWRGLWGDGAKPTGTQAQFRFLSGAGISALTAPLLKAAKLSLLGLSGAQMVAEAFAAQAVGPQQLPSSLMRPAADQLFAEVLVVSEALDPVPRFEAVHVVAGVTAAS